MENLRNRIHVKLVHKEKDYLIGTSKSSYMSHKIFDNNLIAIRKRKLALKRKKPAYVGMCILELSRVLMYEFHYDYIKNKYNNKSKLLLAGTGSLMYMKLKLKLSMKILAVIKNFSNYSTKSKHYDN